MGRDRQRIGRPTPGRRHRGRPPCLGIDVDFAPVADVADLDASFMYRDGRTFSFSAVKTALLADAFATGLESKGVVPTMKHFPGLGFATRNTDAYASRSRASRLRSPPACSPIGRRSATTSR